MSSEVSPDLQQSPEDGGPVIFFDADDPHLSAELEALVGRADAREILKHGSTASMAEVFEVGDPETAALRSLLLKAFGSSELRVQYAEGRASFTDLQRSGNMVTARGCVPTAESWTSSFLHGPDVTYALVELAGELLERDEHFVELASLKFRSLMQTQMRFMVSDDQQQLGTDEGSAPAITGSLSTNRGRKLHMAGWTTDEPIASRVYRLSRLPADIVGYRLNERVHHSQQVGQDAYAFPFMGSHIDDVVYPFHQQVHTAQEVVMSMVSASIYQNHLGSFYTFAGGFDSFQAPQMSFFRQPGWVILDWMFDDIKMTPRGFELIPCRVDFVDESLRSYGGGLYTHIVSLSERAYKAVLGH